MGSNRDILMASKSKKDLKNHRNSMKISSNLMSMSRSKDELSHTQASFKASDPYYNEFSNKNFLKNDKLAQKEKQESEIYLQFLERIQLLNINLHKFFSKRIKTANSQVSKYLADFIIFQYNLLTKETTRKEFKKTFDSLVRSQNYNHRVKFIILLEAGTLYFSPHRFHDAFSKALTYLEDEESQTVVRTFLKIKRKLIEIACLNDDSITSLVDLASNIRIKFHDKEYIKKESLELSTLIRE